MLTTSLAIVPSLACQGSGRPPVFRALTTISNQAAEFTNRITIEPTKHPSYYYHTVKIHVSSTGSLKPRSLLLPNSTETAVRSALGTADARRACKVAFVSFQLCCAVSVMGVASAWLPRGCCVSGKLPKKPAWRSKETKASRV